MPSGSRRSATSSSARHGEDRFPIVVADMASLASVRGAVAEILATEPRLDVLIDNAGAIYPTRRESPDGIEATLAVLVVGPFALISGLLPLLRADGGGRVISVTSGGMYTQAVDLADLEWRDERVFGRARLREGEADPDGAWCASGAVASRDRGVVVNAMHPGWADTPGLAESLPRFYRVMRPLLRTPAQGVDTIVWLASDRRTPARHRAAVPGSAAAPVRPGAVDAPVGGGSALRVGQGGDAGEPFGPGARALTVGGGVCRRGRRRPWGCLRPMAPPRATGCRFRSSGVARSGPS